MLKFFCTVGIDQKKYHPYTNNNDQVNQPIILNEINFL